MNTVLRINTFNEDIFDTCSRSKYRKALSVYDLYMAVVADCLPLVRKILDSDSGLDANISVKDATVLSLALYKRKFDIFRQLMEYNRRSKKLNLNKRSKDHLGRTEPPIVTATRLFFADGVFKLVEAGADIDVADSLGHTALWVASRQQIPQLVDYLIGSGASVNKTDVYNCTPLCTAINYKAGYCIVKSLVYNGSNLDGNKPPASTQISPIYLAAKYGDMESLKLLISAGVPIGKIQEIRHSLFGNEDSKNAIACFLDSESRAPHSLKKQCRRVIRNSVSISCQGKYFVQNVYKLPLPPSVTEFVLLN